MNNFVKGMAMGMVAGVAVGTVAEMWMVDGSIKKSRLVKKGKRVISDLMD
ncbi:MAG: hypothetical protein IKV30_06450 [Clostridia bacterium]|nr:hypothetical protein [Clostridia bacterium]